MCIFRLHSSFYTMSREVQFHTISQRNHGSLHFVELLPLAVILVRVLVNWHDCRATKRALELFMPRTKHGNKASKEEEYDEAETR